MAVSREQLFAQGFDDRIVPVSLGRSEGLGFPAGERERADLFECEAIPLKRFDCAFRETSCRVRIPVAIGYDRVEEVDEKRCDQRARFRKRPACVRNVVGVSDLG